MVIEDLYRFNQLEKAVGNRYAAVAFIARKARRLGIDKKEYHLFESKLIQWVLTGTCPYTEYEMECKKIRANYSELDPLLEWVDDKQVSDNVKYYYTQSIRNHKLTCCEDTSISKGRVTRINILLRMAWYSSLE